MIPKLHQTSVTFDFRSPQKLNVPFNYLIAGFKLKTTNYFRRNARSD